MIKERPILMNAAMVRATLAGTKTQTRRVVKFKTRSDGARYQPIPAKRVDETSYEMHCPHGNPGDRLWVRENFQPFWAEGVSGKWQTDWKTGKGYAPSYPATDGVQEFLDGDDNLRDTVKPSIHMPRWASRILLEITSVRVERLQDIGVEDIEAEGVVTSEGDIMQYGCRARVMDWRKLWESTGGNWDANPWLWVIEFRRVTP